MNEFNDLYTEEIEGREFDWFSIDMDGNIALLATAGKGFLPYSVLMNFRLHDFISEKLDAPHWGSPEVWNDYADLGLYVFDWQLHDGPYVLQRKPTQQIDIQLKEQIIAIVDIPKYKNYFYRNKVISDVQEFS